MEDHSTEDKLGVLNTIFGNDLTQSVISNTLQDNGNQFDPTVEKLLTLPANKTASPPPQPQPAPMDNKAKENIQTLHTMFGDLTQSVITTVYESNKRDVEGTVDTLLNLTSNEVASGARREAEIARQEQELRAVEEFKQLQQRIEQERKRDEAKAKEDETRKKAVEDQRRKDEHERKILEEHNKALQEQERMLLEFQRKKAEEQQKKDKEDRDKKAIADKQAHEEAARLKSREAEAKAKVDAERQRLETERKRLEELKLAEEKRAKERKVAEEKLAMKKLEEENQNLQRQKNLAENERKLLETRMKEELQREEEERKKLAETERRLRAEQEQVRKNWEEQVKKFELERRAEDQKRMEEEAKRSALKRAEEEERARYEADMRKVLELERLKLDEQRRRVEEEKKDAEAKLRAMELAAKKREEEEEVRQKAEQERKQKEEDRKREEAERIRLLEEEQQTRERLREEMSKVMAQEQFAASAVLVPTAVDEPKVQIQGNVDGTSIRGAWSLQQGTLPSSAWLGLFARRSINTYVGFSYLTGTSGEFLFKGLTPGHYEVRIFSNKQVTSRIAESEAMLVGPMVLAFGAQLQGEQIMLEYKLDPPSVPTTWDWVGIYEKSQRRNKNYLSSTYGNANGMISVTLPRAPGDYQARLFAAGAKYNEQATVDFSIADNDCITADVVDGVVKASWVMRTVETTSSDWIGLFAAGENSSNNSKYLTSAYTHGASVGQADIPLPKDIIPGMYELRLFSSKVGKYVTFKTSNVITIN